MKISHSVPQVKLLNWVSKSSIAPPTTMSQNAAASITDNVKGAVRQSVKWASKNPGSAAIVGVGAVAIAAPVVVSAPVLGLMGFGASGVVGGSFAAGIQATIGNVAAGSAFAMLQSAGAGGAGAAVVGGVVQAVGVLGVATTAVRTRLGGTHTHGHVEDEEIPTDEAANKDEIESEVEQEEVKVEEVDNPWKTKEDE